jgi:phosphate/sulfate permease
VTTGSLVGLRRFTAATSTNWLSRILLAWAATLPLAAILAAGTAAILR